MVKTRLISIEPQPEKVVVVLGHIVLFDVVVIVVVDVVVISPG